MPLITIITVVYNDYLGLKKTLSSVNEQSSNVDFEYIVVDGKSTDSTVALLENSRLITKYISEKDNGIYDAMNKGLALSSGEWIVFLNAGDVFYDGNTLSKVKENILEASDDVNFMFGKYLSDGVEYEQDLNIKFLTSYMINHQSIFYRRSLFDNGTFSIDYKYCADYKHLIDNFLNIVSHKMNFIVSVFDNTGISSQDCNKYKMWIERLRSIWDSSLPLQMKIIMSKRGIFALPYQFIRAKLIMAGVLCGK
ncbi:glycosyltransferase family 2 protein [Enterobacter sp. P82]|uniref:glycosyltransferase family 2 protein n=1 Tax=Enterobacter sp. P82 TaxID=3123033 RepID=UPI00300C356D